MRPLLGCIADDFTGATDLASNLVEAGMRTIQWIGLPHQPEAMADAEAIVVALKTRAAPRDEAVRQSLAALDALHARGIERFYFKYCSTFDSTDQGNIGPVAEALLASLGASQTIYCPAFPENSRTVYQGHLFVGDRLLNESGMQRHPLNPMTDANLVRVLARQVTQPVALLPYNSVEQGRGAIAAALESFRQAGKVHIVVDALNDNHLRELAAACAPMPLVTAGSGLALGLPAAYRAEGWLRHESAAAPLPHVFGRTAILAGSCSSATQAQVAFQQSRAPWQKLDIEQCVCDRDLVVASVVRWAHRQDASKPVLIFSTAAADEVAAMQAKFGHAAVASAVESTLAQIAATLVAECGVRRLIVAGGETAGAIVSRLGIHALGIGPRIVPGVPWTQSMGERPLALALKSGNFGGPDFFQVAVEMLP